MNTVIITNNPKVNIEYADKERVEYYPDDDQIQILLRARDAIHLGARLIMHPMPGRIKPHETPYKSVFLDKCYATTDFNSLIIIEDSIAETRKFMDSKFSKKYDDSMLGDLQYIDLLLLQSGVEEYRR